MSNSTTNASTTNPLRRLRLVAPRAPLVVAVIQLGLVASVIPGSPSAALAGQPPRGYAVFDVIGGQGQVYAINNQGQITGHADNGVIRENAFLWNQGTLTWLNNLDPTCFSAGFDVNDAGEVAVQAGFRTGTYCEEDACVWNAGSVTMIPPLNPVRYSEANAINALGQVVGESDIVGNQGPNAFLWLPAPAYGLPAGTNDLGRLAGDDTSEAHGVNAFGEVVGVSLPFGVPNPHHAFIWLPAAAYGLPAGINDLGSLGGMYTHAMDINDSGQVVGDGVNANGFNVAFLWQNQAMTDLDTINGVGMFSLAEAINNVGDVVGMSDTATPPPNQEHACIWYNGQPVATDLNSFLPPGSPWILSYATDINDLGQIVGFGLYNMVARSWLLTPIVDADFDADGDVDAADHDHLQTCLEGPGSLIVPSCDDADLDGDNDVDLGDYSLLQQCFSGNGIPAKPGC